MENIHPVSTDGWKYMLSTDLQVFETAPSYRFHMRKVS